VLSAPSGYFRLRRLRRRFSGSRAVTPQFPHSGVDPHPGSRVDKRVMMKLQIVFLLVVALAARWRRLLVWLSPKWRAWPESLSFRAASSSGPGSPAAQVMTASGLSFHWVDFGVWIATGDPEPPRD
jgi:hypothetical protein